MVTNKLSDLRIKIFADVGSAKEILDLPSPISGYTTNPSLIRKNAMGALSYDLLCHRILAACGDSHKPISFEVFADDPDEMIRQAMIISGWGTNVYVKIPVTDTKGRFMGQVIKDLSYQNIKINVTAIMTAQQVDNVANMLDMNVPAIVSVFAGRIADTGINPANIMTHAASIFLGSKNEILWASCREVLNIFQAEECGCDIITVTPDILAKLPLVGKDLTEYSLDTVRQFHRDAGGFSL